MSVSTSLTLQDRMTNTLQRQVAALDRMINRMERLDRITDTIDPGAGFDAAVGSVDALANRMSALEKTQQRTARTADRTTDALRGMERQQQRVESGAERIKRSWGGVKGIIAAAVAGLSLKAGVQFTFGGALKLDTIEREFQARLGSVDIGSAMYDKIRDQAKSSAFAFDELAKNALSFLSVTTNPQQLDRLGQLAQQLAIFDKTGQGLEGAGFSLKEAMSGDIVSLAERFNMNKAQIRAFGIDDLGKKGDINGFINQFEKLMEYQNMGKAEYEIMLKAPEKQLGMFLSNMRVGFAQASLDATNALMPLIQSFNAWFASDRATLFFNNFAQGLYTVSMVTLWLVGGLKFLGSIIGSIGSLVVDNWSMISPILWGIIAAMVVYNALSGIAWLTTIQSTAAKVAHTVASWAEYAAIFALIWAQNGFNAALAACPISWIIIGIIAIIAIFYAAIGAFNHLAGTSISATGLIVGAVFWAGSVIGNVLISIVNLGIDVVALLMNHWISFAEFFANLFNDPIGSVVRLFASLADTALSTLQMIASAMDTIFGTDFAKTLGGWRDKLQGMTDNLVGEAKIKIQRVDPTAAHIKRLDNTDAFDKGYNIGKNLKLPSMPKMPEIKQPNPNALDNFTGNKLGNIDKVGEVGKIGSDVNIAEEDIQILRDLAESKFVQNFVTLTPKVSLHDIKISEKVDLEEVAAHIERKLEEEFVAAAEGVYS